MYFDYFGTNGEPEMLAAALQDWHQHWGAELVAHWSTILQFTVARRPASGDEAWTLAGQLLRLGSSIQLPRWQLALIVERSTTWFLHDRP